LNKRKFVPTYLEKKKRKEKKRKETTPQGRLAINRSKKSKKEGKRGEIKRRCKKGAKTNGTATSCFSGVSKVSRDCRWGGKEEAELVVAVRKTLLMEQKAKRLVRPGPKTRGRDNVMK